MGRHQVYTRIKQKKKWAMLDYHAKLTINLSKTARKTLAIWLRAKAAECECECTNDDYSKIYTSRLMK